MANRETFPASLFPLRGDVSAESGAVAVIVTGIQQTPVDPTVPTAGQILVADSTPNWVPRSINACISVNSIPVSDDYSISVNLPLGISSAPVLINGA